MTVDIPASFYVACAHAIFANACLLSKEKRGSHDVIGSLWISLVALAIMRRSILLMGPWDTWFIRMVGYPAAYGPLAFLYGQVLAEARPLRWTDGLHAIPFFVLSLATALQGSTFAAHTIEASGPEVRVSFTLMGTLSLLSMIVYAAASIRLINKHRVRLRQYFSNITPARSLLWLNALNGIFILYLIPLTAYHAGLVEPHAPPASFTSAVFVGYLLLISVFIVRQPSIYHVPLEEEDKSLPRYERSAVSKERMTEIESAFYALMTEKKPYLNDDLDLPGLSSLLRVSPHQLSQTLNLKIGKSFHTVVNEYRVREAEKRLADPAYGDYSIQRIALDCGFNSKSSFHDRFKKLKGISPGEFRQLQAANTR